MKAYLHLLTEAKKPRSAYKQELKQQFVGPTKDEPATRFAPDAPWVWKVQQLFIDYKTPPAIRRRILFSFKALEKKNGEEYMQKIPDNVIRELVHSFANKYADDQELKAPIRIGVSSIYHRADKMGSFRRETPTAALNRNLTDINVPLLNKKDLETSTHPSVNRLSRALSPTKDDYIRDKAIVWDLAGQPYYLFVKLFKQHPGAKRPDASGKRTFEIVIPRELDFRHGRKMEERYFEVYNKSTPWYREMRTSEMASLHQFKITGGSFDGKVDALQGKAWELAKPWFTHWKQYQDQKLKLETLKAGYLASAGGHDPTYGLLQDKVDELNKLELQCELLLDIITGKIPSSKFYNHLGADKQAEVLKSLHQSASVMPRSYTWYLWLLIAEDEYGIRVAERQAMYPHHPVTPRAVKGLEPHWPIRPVQEQGGQAFWNLKLLQGIGYSPTTEGWERFEAELRKSDYKLYSSPDEIERLWVPLVGDIRDQFGLKLHPANITDYIDAARKAKTVRSKTRPLLGRVGGRIAVLEGLPIAQYRFKEGPQNREFALVSAAGYMANFDSPYHGGERLVHGMSKPVEPVDPHLAKPTSHLFPSKVTPSGFRQRKPLHIARSTEPGKRPSFSAVPVSTERRREQIDAAYIENLVNLRRTEFLKKATLSKAQKARERDKRYRLPAQPPPHALVHRVIGRWEGPPSKVVTSTTQQREKRQYRYGEPKYGDIERVPYTVKGGPQRKFVLIDKGTIHKSKTTGAQKFYARRALAQKTELVPSVQYMAPPPSWLEYWLDDLKHFSLEDKKKMGDDPNYAAEMRAFSRQQYDNLVKKFYEAHSTGFIMLNPSKVPGNRG